MSEPEPFIVAMLISTLGAWPQNAVVEMRLDDLRAEVTHIATGVTTDGRLCVILESSV